MRLLLATWFSLVLGFLPHHLAFAAQVPEKSGCCGCQCGMQPPTRPAQVPSTPAVTVETRNEERELRSTESVSRTPKLPKERIAAIRSDLLSLPPGVPLFQRYCALLI